MSRKKIIKRGLIIMVLGILVAVSIFLSYWFMPHRDVQAAPIDYNVTSTGLVKEYLNNADKANSKYLQEEGESKILGVTGRVAAIDKDMEGNATVLLKNEGDDLGVLCYFLKETSKNAQKLKIGQKVTIKGVIRSGAEYDEDLDLYEDAILQKCDVIK